MAAPPDRAPLPPRPTDASRPADVPAGVSALCDRLAADLRRRWREGERPLAEDFLAGQPVLLHYPEAAIDLIYEELCLRQECGVPGTADDLFARFPQWREQLEVLLRCHELLEAAAPEPNFPRAGEALGEFDLTAELGRGARGRVFLASQSRLAGRQVVVKLTPREGGEHTSLARLQHTHIVPLYSVQDDEARHLRVLCMPFFGGTTLARVLQDLADVPPAQRTGRKLLAALDRAAVTAAVVPAARSPARTFLAQASYPGAVCWVGACLADALQYAHERGLVHLDVKPSNVLLAADGQPMLLDFHLAREPLTPAGPPPEGVGGSPAYMSPEQQAAVAAVRQGQAVPAVVDGRSDVYSLGLVLYEALGGPLPPDQSRRLEPYNSAVSVGLADILSRCTAPRATERYPSAAALAADLRRHLTDQPLRGVANRSWTERWRKWHRRRPHAVRLVAMGVAVLLTALGLGVAAGVQILTRQADARELLQRGQRLRESGQPAQAVEALRRAAGLAQSLPLKGELMDDIAEQLRLARHDQFREVEGLLHQGQRLAGRQEHEEALHTLQRGLVQAEDLPGQAALVNGFRDAIRWTKRAQAAQELRRLVDRLRFLDGATSAASRRAWEAEERSCRAMWAQRRLLLEPGNPGAPDTGPSIREDLLDLAVLWTELRVRFAGSAPQAQKMLLVLKEAEKELGPSPVLALEHQRHAAALGLHAEAQAAAGRAKRLQPTTAWDYYALGRSFLRAGCLEEAAAKLREAVRLRPDGLWANYYAGVCALRLHHDEDATLAFTACLARAPRSAPCFANRALAFSRLGRKERALEDYSEALTLEPTLAPAALNRGLLHLEARHWKEASDDFNQALANGADPAVAHYNLALVCRAAGNLTAAREHLAAALRSNPRHAEARRLQQALDRLR